MRSYSLLVDVYVLMEFIAHIGLLLRFELGSVQLYEVC